MAKDLPSLVLRCLGPPSVQVDGREPPAEVLWRKHLALLSYLALSPDGTRSRNHLMGLLWAERPEDNARRSLNEAVRLLRVALGADRLLTNGETLQLNAQALEVDALQFQTLSGEGRLAALDLIRGDFLEGFHLDEAPAFDQWMEMERRRIREAGTRLLIALAEEQLAVNRYIEARALARRALALNPSSEHAISLGMRSAALEGDTTGALAAYREFAGHLERDLGERPSATLAGLAARIRAGAWQHPGGRYSDLEPPLVGRRDQHARLFTTFERVPRDGPACCVIAGEAGSGRTRLLDACAERLALAGATVARARILESDHDAPWSTLRALMRGGLLGASGIAATRASHSPACLVIVWSGSGSQTRPIVRSSSKRSPCRWACTSGDKADNGGSAPRRCVHSEGFMLLSRFIPLAAALALAGCRSADVLRFDSTVRPETHPDSVQLLAQEPGQPYTVIALVSARSGGWPWPPAETRLRREAARLGGDAVLLGTESLTRVHSGSEYGGTVVQVTGKVIVFKRAAKAPT